MNRPSFTSAAVAFGAALFLALAMPLAANSHVRINPNTADPGSYATLVFKVPTESATHGTTKLVIDLPTATPFASASYQPVPGWTGQIITGTLPGPVSINGTTLTEAPTTIVYTANPGVEIAPKQFQQFIVSVGPVPDTSRVMFPAHQTYSDGHTVDWAEATDSSGVEPGHPAPTLFIRDPPPLQSQHGVLSATEVTQSHVASSDSSNVLIALGLAIGAITLAVVGCALALGAITLVRRTENANRAHDND